MGFLICWLLLNSIYHKIFSDPLTSSLYGTTGALFGLPIPDGKFAGLKWSAARHGIVALISGLLIYFTFPGNAIICRVIIGLNILYFVFVYLRYSSRRRGVYDNYPERPIPQFIKDMVKPSFYVVLYCVYLITFLSAVYGLRPLN